MRLCLRWNLIGWFVCVCVCRCEQCFCARLPLSPRPCWQPETSWLPGGAGEQPESNCKGKQGPAPGSTPCPPPHTHSPAHNTSYSTLDPLVNELPVCGACRATKFVMLILVDRQYLFFFLCVGLCVCRQTHHHAPFCLILFHLNHPLPEGARGEATLAPGCWYTLLQPQLACVCVAVAAGSLLQRNQEGMLIQSDRPERSLLSSQQTAWGGTANFTLATFWFELYLFIFLFINLVYLHNYIHYIDYFYVLLGMFPLSYFWKMNVFGLVWKELQ